MSSLGANILKTSPPYLVSGVVLDSGEYGIHGEMFVVALDESGDVLWEKQHGNELFPLSSLSDAAHETIDGNYAIAQRTLIDDLSYGVVIVVNEQGDSVNSVVIESPYLEPFSEDPNDHSVPQYLVIDDDENMFVTMQIANNSSWNDLVVFKLANNLEIEWYHIYATSADPDICHSLVTDNAGVICGIASSTPDSLVLATKHFFKLDLEGEMVWEFYLEPIQSGPPNEMILEGDGIVVCAELLDDDLDGIAPYIYKTDFEGNIIWDTVVGNEFEDYQEFSNLVKAQDGGYVAAAKHYEPDPGDPDTNGTYNWNGWLVKFTEDGDIVWDRKYHFLESTQDDHEIYDLKATSDGGYIFCGEATDSDTGNPDNQAPYQRAWVVKVDACGCLVPGCDPDCVVSTNDLKQLENQPFLVGPIPASQFLNVHVVSQDYNAERQFQIHDLQGKLLDSFNAPTGGTTYMYDVTKMAIGTYILTLFEDDRVTSSMQFLVQR